MMNRDDNNQQREEHEHQQWEELWKKNQELLKGFDELRPIIQGKKNE